MLTLSAIVNVVLLGLLFRSSYAYRKLNRRLVHMCTKYETLWLRHHEVNAENIRYKANSQVIRYHLESMRRDIKLILGIDLPNTDDLRTNTNMPPLQPVPPECRMVKESFTE